MYLIITEGLCAHMFKADSRLTSGMRWLTTDRTNGMHQLVRSILVTVQIMGKDEQMDPDTWRTKLVFAGAQLVYTLIAFAVAFAVAQSAWIHLTFVLSMVLTSVAFGFSAAPKDWYAPSSYALP